MIPNVKSKVLFIGAHPDDIELNCLGTILKWKKIYNIEVHLLMCTLGGINGNIGERKNEQILLSNKYGTKSSYFLNYDDGYLQHNAKLVSEIEDVINEVKPDFIFTHSPCDYHQDHISVSSATVSALREKLINLIFYPSITMLGNPLKVSEYNLIIDITDEMDSKLDLLKNFKTQNTKYYFKSEYITDYHKLNTPSNSKTFVEKFSIGCLIQ